MVIYVMLLNPIGHVHTYEIDQLIQVPDVDILLMFHDNMVQQIMGLLNFPLKKNKI